MSQAYAQRIRNVAIATTAATAVFLAFGLYWIQRVAEDASEPRRLEFARFRPAGQPLQFARLAVDERVVVTHVVNGGRESRAWTYVIDGISPQLLTRMTRKVLYESGYGLRPSDITAVDDYELTTDDLVGLDLALRFLRAVPADSVTRFYDTFAIEYFRDGKLIGEERFVDDTLRRHDDLGYERLPIAATRKFSVMEWEAIVTFAEITRSRRVEPTTD